ncbi:MULTISPECIES: A/G-specific adenine glycosylase [unclassified Herbaspirillum]|uniref:A/G-specific adenine glycosylase n=1 Tax=unclassified Herbaspirillum TaxID=2624150 RepID=UPI0011526ED7|nr:MULTISPECIES: A/G-specific adenine glycosylase [unclassified Herbaspirillum]MBB5392254.1 A/G-specific adenine glycosylase [Herbaspirillum sp. SJZ102]TQK05896.1 A/G-specific DNA-adenine glycosylase [Herbaspirillum sp. SJZ130]TQK12626.1 A/G-specific DNA-adenine glycosylase [Herbaspirillum sp. SJZ106]
MKGLVTKGQARPRRKGAPVDGERYADPSFSAAVIGWQKQHGRHALPWQNTRDAYRVWLSEIMLQQTQVAAVIPYYQRFLERCPDVFSLAAAPSEDVMALWSGLGYYTRARNLHKCAQRVVNEYGGRFPDDPDLLADLPGIGRSTAAAIAAFSYGRRAAILDGNVKRVFARVFGIDGYPGAKPIEDQLWLRAVALLPDEGIEAYTQGLMDLGATLCVRGTPSCKKCPLAERCVALAQDRVGELPVSKPKKAVPEKETVMLVVTHGGDVLLEQRPDSGIWGGLLSLPEIAVGNAGQFESAVQALVAPYGELEACRKLQPFSHVFTHFKLHIAPFQVALKSRSQRIAQHALVWYPVEKLAEAPLPAPVKKLLLGVLRSDDLLAAV